MLVALVVLVVVDAFVGVTRWVSVVLVFFVYGLTMVVVLCLLLLSIMLLVVLGLFDVRCVVLLLVAFVWWFVDRLILMFAVFMFALWRTEGRSFGCGGGVDRRIIINY